MYRDREYIPGIFTQYMFLWNWEEEVNYFQELMVDGVKLFKYQNKNSHADARLVDKTRKVTGFWTIDNKNFKD